jgi:putative ATP-dependent DNA ligase
MGRARAADLPSRLEAAQAAGRTQHSRHGEATYVRITEDGGDLRRGEVVLTGGGTPRLVPSFPSIARVVALEAGARAHAQAPLRVEEKIDGYNVRIVRWQGEVLAFTRGGFACPFTLDRLSDLADLEELFEEAPDAVLCAEIAGPGNPYMTAQARPYTDDVALFAFDLMALDDHGPRHLRELDALCARYEVPRAPQLLRMPVYDEGSGAALATLALDLDARGAEGMILKPERGGLRLKYVTPAVNLADIAADGWLLAELPGGFFTSRMLRFLIGARELGARERMRAFEITLGRQLAAGLARSLEQVQRDGKVYEDVAIRVRDPETVNQLVAHLNRSSRVVKCQVVTRAREGVYTRAVIRKQMMRSTSYLKSLLGGDTIID